MPARAVPLLANWLRLDAAAVADPVITTVGKSGRARMHARAMLHSWQTQEAHSHTCTRRGLAWLQIMDVIGLCIYFGFTMSIIA